MILKSAGYSILTFTLFVFIIGIINYFTFRTYSLVKKGKVFNKKCNPTMEVDFNFGPPSKKWTRIGGSRRYKKIIKDNFETGYLINEVKRLKNKNISNEDEKPEFYTECVYDVKYKVDNKNLKSTIKQRFESIGGIMFGDYKKNADIYILVNKNKPKDIIRFQFIHNFSPYLIFFICFILILISVFLIYLDNKVAEVKNEF